MQTVATSPRHIATRWWPAVAAVAVLGAPMAAHADVSFCNRSAAPLSVAFAEGEMDPPGVTTGGHLGVHVEGWWKLAPAACTRVSRVDANTHWLYYFAHAGDRRWAGDSLLCVTDHRFENRQPFSQAGGSCRNARLEGFKRFESRTRNFTMNLD